MLSYPRGARSSSDHNSVSGSMSINSAVPGISFASQNVSAPLSNLVNADRLGDFSKN